MLVQYRLILKRPETGIDLPWPWSSWDETVRMWWAARDRECKQGSVMIQMLSKGKQTEGPLDPQLMHEERVRLMLTEYRS